MRIKVIHGPKMLEPFQLANGPNLAGREAICRIRLPGQQVSRQHALFHLEQGRVRVDDLGTANGLIDSKGLRVSSLWMKPGDRVWIGEYQVELEDERPDDLDLEEEPELELEESPEGERTATHTTRPPAPPPQPNQSRLPSSKTATPVSRPAAARPAARPIAAAPAPVPAPVAAPIAAPAPVAAPAPAPIPLPPIPAPVTARPAHQAPPPFPPDPSRSVVSVVPKSTPEDPTRAQFPPRLAPARVPPSLLPVTGAFESTDSELLLPEPEQTQTHTSRPAEPPPRPPPLTASRPRQDPEETFSTPLSSPVVPRQDPTPTADVALPPPPLRAAAARPAQDPSRLSLIPPPAPPAQAAAEARPATRPVQRPVPIQKEAEPTHPRPAVPPSQPEPEVTEEAPAGISLIIQLVAVFFLLIGGWLAAPVGGSLALVSNAWEGAQAVSRERGEAIAIGLATTSSVCMSTNTPLHLAPYDHLSGVFGVQVVDVSGKRLAPDVAPEVPEEAEWLRAPVELNGRTVAYAEVAYHNDDAIREIWSPLHQGLAALLVNALCAVALAVSGWWLVLRPWNVLAKQLGRSGKVNAPAAFGPIHRVVGWINQRR